MPSQEQVCRLVARTPERLNLTILAALCDIFDCGPGDLVEPVREAPPSAPERSTSKLATPRPQRAKVAPGPQR